MIVDRVAFEARYRVDPSGCWIWTLKPNGMGRPLFYSSDRGRQVTASVASYWLYKGEVPEGLEVLHTCDEPMCVNPAHLYLGTQADNTKDAYARGRRVNRRGEQSSVAVLSNADAIEIRRQYKLGGCSHSSLAREFGVSKATIKRILDGTTYPISDAIELEQRPEFKVVGTELGSVALV